MWIAMFRKHYRQSDAFRSYSFNISLRVSLTSVGECVDRSGWLWLFKTPAGERTDVRGFCLSPGPDWMRGGPDQMGGGMGPDQTRWGGDGAGPDWMGLDQTRWGGMGPDQTRWGGMGPDQTGWGEGGGQTGLDWMGGGRTRATSARPEAQRQRIMDLVLARMGILDEIGT